MRWYCKAADSLQQQLRGYVWCGDRIFDDSVGFTLWLGMLKFVIQCCGEQAWEFS